MYELISVANMRKSDAYTIANFTSSLKLMYKAGKGAYEIINQEYKSYIENLRFSAKPCKVAVVCGSGNNAGDGYVIAQLMSTSYDVEIILLKEKFSKDGKHYFDKCKELGIVTKTFSKKINFCEYALIIDCILGTGFVGDVKDNTAQVIKCINQSQAKIVSIDINSGLNGDTGKSKLCVKSNLTISIGTLKTGHVLGISPNIIDKLINVDIGIKPVEKPYLLVDKNEYNQLQSNKNFLKLNKNDYIIVKKADLEKIIYS